MKKQRFSVSGEKPKLLTCDSCGGFFSEFNFVETIEEFLCERCASGYPDDDEDDFHDGMEEGFDE